MAFPALDWRRHHRRRLRRRQLRQLLFLGVEAAVRGRRGGGGRAGGHEVAAAAGSTNHRAAADDRVAGRRRRIQQTFGHELLQLAQALLQHGVGRHEGGGRGRVARRNGGGGGCGRSRGRRSVQRVPVRISTEPGGQEGGGLRDGEYRISDDGRHSCCDCNHK